MTNSKSKSAIVVSVFVAAAAFLIAGPKEDLVSPAGYTATFVKLAGEGEGKTVIWKQGKKIAEIADSRPVSFSPTADVLLLGEYEPDDDLGHFLLDIGKGEFTKDRSRVFGGRYVTGATWSRDGKTITLHYQEDLSDKKEEIFKVVEKLAR